jgi:hypothetical protein
MSRISLLGMLLSLSSFHAACAGSSSSNGSPNAMMYVTDTLGKTFSVSCSSNSFCTLTPKDSSLKALSCDSEKGGTDTFALLYETQILTVHALLVPTAGYISLNAAEPARPVACATDADCLPDLFSSPFTCQNGLCQYISIASPMQTVDVIALCQADIPWPKDCPYLTEPSFAKRMAEVAALCGSAAECSQVPADCRQPIAIAPAPDASAAPSAPSIDAGAGAVDSGS